MTTITLNRKQIEDLAKIKDHFNEVEQFRLCVDSSNGIGPVVHVKFTLFDSNSTSVNITDVSDW